MVVTSELKDWKPWLDSLDSVTMVYMMGDFEVAQSPIRERGQA
jgi:hypothetical protein